MLNGALSTCHSLYWSEHPAAPGAMVKRAPYIQFDAQAKLFVLYCDYALFDPRPVAGTESLWTANQRDQTDIYFNTGLYQLLSSFPVQFLGNPGDLNYRIAVDNMSGTKITPVKDNFDGTVRLRVPVYQEISTVSTWNPIGSIVFCTSLIPIVSTNTSPPMLYDSKSTNLTSSGANNKLTNILTDFEVPITETNQYRPAINFTPPGEFRLVDTHAVHNLNKLDIIVFWKSHYGNLIPLRLQPGCAAHIKIMFRHKKFKTEADVNDA